MLGFFLETTCPRLTIFLLGGCHFPRLSVFFFLGGRKTACVIATGVLSHMLERHVGHCTRSQPACARDLILVVLEVCCVEQKEEGRCWRGCAGGASPSQ